MRYFYVETAEDLPEAVADLHDELLTPHNMADELVAICTRLYLVDKMTRVRRVRDHLTAALNILEELF